MEKPVTEFSPLPKDPFPLQLLPTNLAELVCVVGDAEGVSLSVAAVIVFAVSESATSAREMLDRLKPKTRRILGQLHAKEAVTP
jgi:hypothetical protein